MNGYVVFDVSDYSESLISELVQVGHAGHWNWQPIHWLTDWLTDWQTDWLDRVLTSARILIAIYSSKWNYLWNDSISWQIELYDDGFSDIWFSRNIITGHKYSIITKMQYVHIVVAYSMYCTITISVTHTVNSTVLHGIWRAVSQRSVSQSVSQSDSVIQVQTWPDWPDWFSQTIVEYLTDWLTDWWMSRLTLQLYS